jgi:hypothetical protein
MGFTHLQIEPNPWLGGYRTQIPDPRSLCPLSSTEFVEPPTHSVQNSCVRHWQWGMHLWLQFGFLHVSTLSRRFIVILSHTRQIATLYFKWQWHLSATCFPVHSLIWLLSHAIQSRQMTLLLCTPAKFKYGVFSQCSGFSLMNYR